MWLEREEEQIIQDKEAMGDSNFIVTCSDVKLSQNCKRGKTLGGVRKRSREMGYESWCRQEIKMASSRAVGNWNGEKLKDFRDMGSWTPFPCWITQHDWLHIDTTFHTSALWRQALPLFSTALNWIIQAAKSWTFKLLSIDLGLTPSTILATAVQI